MAQKKKKTAKRSPRVARPSWWPGRLVLGAVVLAATALLVLGMIWRSQLMLEQVSVSGARHAEPAALRALARVDSVQRLFDVDPVLVADRVVRHPWVASAKVRRLPTGTLAISVAERRPVMVVIDRRGGAAYYLDRDGYRMPMAEGAAYDVPLLYGLNAGYHPVQPIEEAAVRRLLPVVAEAAPEMDALLASFKVGPAGDVWLYAPPVAGQDTVPVRLGSDRFTERLERFYGFWHEAVLARPETQFTLIDLRFDSQIVTRETPPPASPEAPVGAGG